MAVVKWSDHAMTCLRQQARYIAEQSQSTKIAWNWMNDILDETERLSDFPRTGHPLPEFPDTPYLEILIRKFFRIIYRIIRIRGLRFAPDLFQCSILLITMRFIVFSAQTCAYIKYHHVLAMTFISHCHILRMTFMIIGHIIKRM